MLVFEGFADWEPAFALAEVRRSGGLDVVTLGFTDAPVRSMGGLRVVPDRAIAGLDIAAVRLLVLPGGDMWEGAYPRADLDALLTELHARGVPVAAICGACARKPAHSSALKARPRRRTIAWSSASSWSRAPP